MQKMFKARCSAREYQLQGKAYPFPDMTYELCPHCRRDFLKKHGYYQRYLILLEFAGEIEIRRYICTECNKTVSLLPSFAHPGKSYGTKFIMGIFNEFYISGNPVCDSVRNFTNGIASCSRQLLRHYRKRIKQNLNMLIMGVVNVLGLRCPPVTSENKKMQVRQFLEYVTSSPEDISLKLFEYSQKTYLTA